MSYLTRKKHRQCAHHLLEVLHEKAPDHELFLTKEDWMNPRIPALTMAEVEASTHKYSLTELKRASRLIQLREEISMVKRSNIQSSQPETVLILTLKGRDSYLDEYYLVENLKDRLETWELITQWIFPIISLLISILALYISTAKK